MSTILASFQKHPNAELDYLVDWSDWLDTDETIASVSWSVPAGLTQPRSPLNTTTSATVWLGAGVADVEYIVACTVTTTANRRDTRNIRIRVRT